MRCSAWASAAGTAWRSTTIGPTGRRHSSASRRPGFPNFFFPGGPHAAAGNNPRYNGDQVEFITDTLAYLRDRGFDTIEVTPEAEAAVDGHGRPGGRQIAFGRPATTSAPTSRASRSKYLLNSGGRPKLFKEIAKVIDTDYAPSALSRLRQTVATGVSG